MALRAWSGFPGAAPVPPSIEERVPGGDMYPSEYLYTREHEWVRVDDDVAVLGITEFAQQELGEVVFVELPEVGQVFDSGDEIGTIESVKAVAEVYSPLAGEVIEVNETLVDDPEVLNEDPHGEGWLIKLRFSSADDLKKMMSAEDYQKFADEGE
jgi:glycine cleavage system H protein